MTISPSFSSCHMASRTSSTRCLLVSMERRSILVSTQAVAVRASLGVRFDGRHSVPKPVKTGSLLLCGLSKASSFELVRKSLGHVLLFLLLFEPLVVFLALLVHHVGDDIEQVFVDLFELI